MIDLVGDETACGPDCPAFLDKWTSWWAETCKHEVAILDCRGGTEAYMKLIGPKGRNMIRKAERLYEFARFPFNDYRDQIEAVNRSKPERQGIPMQGWYTETVQWASVPMLCGLHSDVWLGGFNRSTGELSGYAHVEILNELAIINSFLGHAEASAVMNGLIAQMVEHLGARWINYLHPRSRTQSLSDFKARVGFRPMLVPRSDAPRVLTA